MQKVLLQNVAESVCQRCFPARLQQILDEESSVGTDGCICMLLSCFGCQRPVPYCSCGALPRILEERCLVCDCTFDECLNSLWCGSCQRDISQCPCLSPLFQLVCGECEEGGVRDFRFRAALLYGLDNIVTCGACKQYLSYGQQVRCDASACLLEHPTNDGVCMPVFFHEACLNQVESGLLCSACFTAGVQLEGESVEEEEPIDEEYEDDSEP